MISGRARIPERVARAVAALLVPVGFLVTLVGSPSMLGLGLGLALIALVLFLGRPQAGVADSGWDSAVSVERSRVAPARGPVAPALGVVELRELLLSPWFHAGVGFCVVFLVAISSFENSWWSSAMLFPLLVHPLCGMTILGVHRNVTRPARDGTDELFESCPAAPADRNAAHLWSGVAPVGVALSFVAALMWGSAIVLDGIYGPMGARLLLDVVLAGVVLPIGAVALGLALARVSASMLAPLAAVGFVALVNILVVEEPDGLGWFATARVDAGVDAVFVEPPLLGRFAWMVGLVVATTALAVPPRRSRRAAVIGGVAVFLAAGSFLNLRDLPEDTVARLAGYAAVSVEHSSCTALVDGADLEVCVPQPYEDHGRAMADNLRSLVAMLPDDAIDEPVLFGLAVADVDGLQAQVRDRLQVEERRRVVPLPRGHHRSHFGAARFQAAAVVTGVFTGDDPENVLVDGQSRGVVLIWLATRGLSDGEIETILRPYSRESPSHAGHIWPGICGAPIQWAPEDVAAARLVVRDDAESVRKTIAADWRRWIDPATTTDELLDVLGLPLQGPTSPITPLGAIC